MCPPSPARSGSSAPRPKRGCWGSRESTTPRSCGRWSRRERCLRERTRRRPSRWDCENAICRNGVCRAPRQRRPAAMAPAAPGATRPPVRQSAAGGGQRHRLAGGVGGFDGGAGAGVSPLTGAFPGGGARRLTGLWRQGRFRMRQTKRRKSVASTAIISCRFYPEQMKKAPAAGFTAESCASGRGFEILRLRCRAECAQPVQLGRLRRGGRRRRGCATGVRAHPAQRRGFSPPGTSAARWTWRHPSVPPRRPCPAFPAQVNGSS